MALVLPTLTSVLALLFSIALFDQWRERRRGYQLIWAAGMLFYGVAAGCEAIAAALGWNEALYRTWYLTGAVWTAGWLGLGTAFLLGRTRFGYAFALCLFLAGLFTFLVRNRPEYAGSGTVPLLYFLVAGVLALAVAIETYFGNERWPLLAAGAVLGATVLSAAAHGVDGPAGSRLRGRPADGHPGRIVVPRRPAPAHAVPEHHRGIRAGAGRRLLDLCLHAQAPRPAVLARCRPARRPVPVQPVHRAGRDPGEPRRLTCPAPSRPSPRGASTPVSRQRS